MKKCYRKYVDSVCKQCGKVWSHRADHQAKYCSNKCNGLAIRKPIKMCVRCGKPIIGYSRASHRKYCSPQCNKQGRSLAKRSRLVKVVCDSCGKPFYRTPSIAALRRFCSPACVKNGQTGVGNHLWTPEGEEVIRKNGRVYVKTSQEHWSKIDGHFITRSRKALLDHGIEIPVGTEVHHKNGVVDDDRIENLEVLTKAEHVRKHSKLQWMKIKTGGSKTRYSKLFAEDVVKIKRSLAEGVKASELARWWKVSTSTIKRTQTGLCWSSVRVEK